MTYQQLHNLTSINKTGLRKRLDELVNNGWLITYTYGIPYIRKFYGYIHKHPLCPEHPTARTYYLLNFLNDDVKELVEIFDKQAHIPYDVTSLSSASEEAIKALEEEKGVNNKLDKFILFHNKNRQIEWLQLPRVVGWLKEDTTSETTVNGLTIFTDFITNHRFSILDVIIKCCFQPTIFAQGELVTNLSPIILPMFRYKDITEIFLQTKFKNKLVFAFAIKLKN